MAGEMGNEIQTTKPTKPPGPPQLCGQRMAITKMAKIAIRTAAIRTATGRQAILSHPHHR
jgi:hypothetical protein